MTRTRSVLAFRKITQTRQLFANKQLQKEMLKKLTLSFVLLTYAYKKMKPILTSHARAIHVPDVGRPVHIKTAMYPTIANRLINEKWMSKNWIGIHTCALNEEAEQR